MKKVDDLAPSAVPKRFLFPILVPDPSAPKIGGSKIQPKKVQPKPPTLPEPAVKLHDTPAQPSIEPPAAIGTDDFEHQLLEHYQMGVRDGIQQRDSEIAQLQIQFHQLEQAKLILEKKDFPEQLAQKALDGARLVFEQFLHLPLHIAPETWAELIQELQSSLSASNPIHTFYVNAVDRDSFLAACEQLHLRGPQILVDPTLERGSVKAACSIGGAWVSLQAKLDQLKDILEAWQQGAAHEAP